VSRDGRFLIFQVDHPGIHAPQWLRKLARKVGIGSIGSMTRRRTAIVVADARTGKSLGVIKAFDQPDDDSPFTGLNLSMEMLDVAPRGVVIHSHEGWVRYFELPPRYDWLRLAVWLSGPPVLVCLVGRLRRRRAARLATAQKNTA
jgi:hypothetical protein